MRPLPLLADDARERAPERAVERRAQVLEVAREFFSPHPACLRGPQVTQEQPGEGERPVCANALVLPIQKSRVAILIGNIQSYGLLCVLAGLCEVSCGVEDN